MKKGLFTIILFFPICIAAQSVNPFFPVHQGDYWEYLYFEPQRSDIAQVQLVIDSTDYNGTTYFRRFGNLYYSGDIYPGGHYMIDLLGDVYTLPDWKILPHNAADLDWWVVYEDNSGVQEIAKVDTVYPDTLFSRTTQIMTISYFGGSDTIPPFEGASHNSLTFARGFGIVSGSEAFGGELGPSIDIRGARIDSVEYGYLVKVQEEGPVIPITLQLFPNFPNPFNMQTRIQFVLAYATAVKLVIYNVRGQLVRTLISKTHLEAGQHFVTWNGTNQAGEDVPSGIYFSVLSIHHQQRMRTMTVIK